MSSLSPKTLLNRLGLRPKKTLGQHFLLHPHQARRIVAALNLTGEDTVVEIGAGLGALTGFLAPAARRVIALERDPELARFLAEELLVETPGVEVICQDVLKFDFPGAAREAGRPLAVVGNLPYQITSPLLFTLIRDACGHLPGRAHDAAGGGGAAVWPRRAPRITGFCRSWSSTISG